MSLDSAITSLVNKTIGDDDDKYNKAKACIDISIAGFVGMGIANQMQATSYEIAPLESILVATAPALLLITDRVIGIQTVKQLEEYAPERYKAFSKDSRPLKLHELYSGTALFITGAAALIAEHRIGAPLTSFSIGVLGHTMSLYYRFANREKSEAKEKLPSKLKPVYSN